MNEEAWLEYECGYVWASLIDNGWMKWASCNLLYSKKRAFKEIWNVSEFIVNIEIDFDQEI